MRERERECVQESGEKERAAMAAAIAAAVRAPKELGVEFELSDPRPPYML